MECGTFPYKNIITQEKAETKLESLAHDKFGREPPVIGYISANISREFLLEVQKIAREVTGVDDYFEKDKTLLETCFFNLLGISQNRDT
jgi:hypothetical protein